MRLRNRGRSVALVVFLSLIFFDFILAQQESSSSSSLLEERIAKLEKEIERLSKKCEVCCCSCGGEYDRNESEMRVILDSSSPSSPQKSSATTTEENSNKLEKEKSGEGKQQQQNQEDGKERMGDAGRSVADRDHHDHQGVEQLKLAAETLVRFHEKTVTPDSCVLQNDFTNAFVYDCFRDSFQHIQQQQSPKKLSFTIRGISNTRNPALILSIPEGSSSIGTSDMIIVFFLGRLQFVGTFFDLQMRSISNSSYCSESFDLRTSACLVLSHPPSSSSSLEALDIFVDTYGCVEILGQHFAAKHCQRLELYNTIAPITMLPGGEYGVSLHFAAAIVMNVDSSDVQVSDFSHTLFSRGVFDIPSLRDSDPDSLFLTPEQLRITDAISQTASCAFSIWAMTFKYPIWATDPEFYLPHAPLYNQVCRDWSLCLDHFVRDHTTARDKLIGLSYYHKSLLVAILNRRISTFEVEPLYKLVGLATSSLADFLASRMRSGNEGWEYVEYAWGLLPQEQRPVDFLRPQFESSLEVCMIDALLLGPDGFKQCARDLEKKRQFETLTDAESFCQYEEYEKKKEQNETDPSSSSSSFFCRMVTSPELVSKINHTAEFLEDLIIWTVVERAQSISRTAEEEEKSILETFAGTNETHLTKGRTIVEISAIPLLIQLITESKILRALTKSWEPKIYPPVNVVEAVGPAQETTQKGRSAICITGSLRSSDSAWESNYRLLQDMLPADIFIYTLDDEMVIKALQLRPTALSIKNDTHLDDTDLPEGFGFQSTEKLQRFLQQTYALNECWRMIATHSERTGIKYERVIRYRPDVVHMFGLPRGLPMTHLHTKLVDLGHDYKYERYMCDSFIVGPPEMMEVAMATMWKFCISNVQPYRFNGIWGSELLLQACLDIHKVPTEKHLHWVHFVLRARGSCSSVGCF